MCPAAPCRTCSTCNRSPIYIKEAGPALRLSRTLGLALPLLKDKQRKAHAYMYNAPLLHGCNKGCIYIPMDAYCSFIV